MATILTDNFDSYSNGNLAGQGGWSQGYGSTQFTVEGTTVLQGAKAVSITVSTENIETITKTAVSDGRQTFYVRAAQTNKDFNVIGADNGYPTGNQIWTINFDSVSGNIKLTAGPSATQYDVLVGFIQDHWYCIEIEWRSSDNKLRARVDGGTYTSWVIGQYSRNPNVVKSFWIDARGGTYYFDYFAQDPLVTTNIKTINSLAQASVKTVNNLAIASVKTWNGLA